jgi:hypothetical protein
MPVSAAEYEALLKREMDRFNRGGATEGPRRDQAVRSANIAAGYGNSTALQQRQAQAAAGEPSPETTAAVPAPRPTIESLFVPPEFPKYYGEQPPPPAFVPPEFPQYFGEQPPTTQPPLPFIPPEFPPIYGEQPEPVEQRHRTRFPIDLWHLFQ